MILFHNLPFKITKGLGLPFFFRGRFCRKPFDLFESANQETILKENEVDLAEAAKGTDKSGANMIFTKPWKSKTIKKIVPWNC